MRDIGGSIAVSPQASAEFEHKLIALRSGTRGGHVFGSRHRVGQTRV
jgi:hypothetical protein